MAIAQTLDVSLPDKFGVLFEPRRYKTFYGGRGGAKSWSIARALILIAYSRKVRILCAREFQASIADSVMALLLDQIHLLKLDAWFYVTKTKIVSHTGAEIIFKGLRFHTQEIKSLEGVDICWVEEAQSVSKDSLDVLRPTIRKEGSEIWFSFNTKGEKDPVYDQFVKKCPENGVAVPVLWSDNPYLPNTLNEERLTMQRIDPEAYENIWQGKPMTISDAVIFAKRVEVCCFETPEDVRFFHGLDFGFADDPTAGVRCFVLDECLYIDREAYGWHVELNDLREFLVDNIPTMETWPIRADNARPETISLLAKPKWVDDPENLGKKKQLPGLNVKAAAKWNGCVKDRIDYLKSFKKIYIHEKNCPYMVYEAEQYKYKVDTLTGEVLPVPVDKHNHGWDAIGYSQDEYILAQISMVDRLKAYEVNPIAETVQNKAISMNLGMAARRQQERRIGGVWKQ